MTRKILIFGILAGLITGIPLSIIVLTMSSSSHGINGYLIGYSLMLVGLSMVFVAIKRHRDIDLGGVIGFWRALGMGLAISVVAGIVYAAAWDIAISLAHIDFIDGYAKSVIAAQKAAHASPEKIAKTIAEMEALKAAYANPLVRWGEPVIEIFPIGVLVSLFSAGLLCFSTILPVRRQPA